MKHRNQIKEIQFKLLVLLFMIFLFSILRILESLMFLQGHRCYSMTVEILGLEIQRALEKLGFAMC